jgi:hypothetical protein
MTEYTKPALPEPTVFVQGHGAAWNHTAVDAHADACVAAYKAHIRAEQGEPVAWVPVGERLPKSGQTVLACYTNSAGNVRRIRAEWVYAGTVESGPDSEIGEYDEDKDDYFDPQGWYEKIDNWGDYSSVAVVEGVITHWMPLPAEPGSTAPQAPLTLSDEPEDPCPQCMRGGVCTTWTCGRKVSSELMRLYGTPQTAVRDEPEDILATYSRTDGRREWVTVGCWLRPGEEIVHRAVLAAAQAK